MEWKVVNSLNRDVERQQLNAILKDIRSTIGGLSATSTPTNTNTITNTITRYAVARFTLTLEGDVTGSALVDGTGDVTLTTTLSGDVGVEEAPVDNQYYFRWNGEWQPAPPWVSHQPEGFGILVQVENDEYEKENIVREIEIEPGELTVVDGDGVAGNPTLGLADLADSGVGTGGVKLITRDAKGRVEGTQDASTTNLPEGSNLYFTDERAQDALAAAFAAGTHTGITITYTDGSNKFDFVVTGTGDVVGPASSVNNHVVFFDGVTGKLIKDSGLTLSGTNTGDQTSIVGITGTLAEFNAALTGADFATGGGTVTGTSSGTNTGDQTSIVGITGTKAQFDTACTDGNFAYQTDLTPTGVGLSNVTNDAQTKAAIVPNTAPSAGQILVGNAGGTAYAPVSVSGDITMTSAGVVSLSAPAYFACTTSANSLADNNSAQNVFPSAVDTFTAEASTSYWLDAEIFISTGGGTYSVGFGLAGTATFTSIGYHCMGVKAAAGALSVNINNRWVTTASNTTVTSSNTTAGAILSIRGIIRVNGAGTLIPQITFSAAPGGTNQVEPNSFFRLQKMGSNTVASFGAWA